MSGAAQERTGPDLSGGFPLSDLVEGQPLLGRVGDEPVLVFRRGEEVSVVGASCTHYGGPLAEGLVDGDRVRCPWHHACFSLRTGEAVSAPALNPLPRWEATVRDGRVLLGGRIDEDPLAPRVRSASGPAAVVILGAGAAGSAAAEMLRREGFEGSIVMVDPDPDAPCDRPNLSKDYLAGSAPEEWIPLRPASFYGEHGIQRRLTRAEAIDRDRCVVHTAAGEELAYDALILATGAVARGIEAPGADLPHVHTLRSLGDCRGIIASAKAARSAVVIGASFIGMEAAASLRARGLEVTVVAPDAVPFERALGPELGAVLQDAHERHGVVLRLGRTVRAITTEAVLLDDGSALPAQVVVVGIGVQVDTRLAEAAGLGVDDGVLVDPALRTADPRIYAAGDLARVVGPEADRGARIEHWVVAQRQGQTAARSILGHPPPRAEAPFFWTRQFDVGISYVGHATDWDAVEVDGDPLSGDAAFRYVAAGRTVAVATIGRDGQALEAAAALVGTTAVSPAPPAPAGGAA